MKFNVTDILKTANRSLSMTKLKIAKHSPEILLVAGVVGTVASAVLACHETTKISKILDDAGATVDAIHDCIEHPERAENYTAEDGQKDLLITYTQTGMKLVKLYAPSVILGGLSIAAILANNNILRKRNVALAAALPLFLRARRLPRSCHREVRQGRRHPASYGCERAGRSAYRY